MLAPTRRGAHPPHLLAAPSLDLVAGWSRDAGILMVDHRARAARRPRGRRAPRRSRGRGLRRPHRGRQPTRSPPPSPPGPRLVTHLGNAMPPMLAREPGPVGPALAGPDLVAGVIADGHHLHPATLQAFWRALGPERFLAVSDTTAALGMAAGPARLGDQDVVVADGTVRLADGTLAGSAASLAQCLAVLLATTGCSLAEAVATATSTPARLIGDGSRGSLAPGRRGDLTLVDPRRASRWSRPSSAARSCTDRTRLMEVVPLATADEVAAVAADAVEGLVRPARRPCSAWRPGRAPCRCTAS